METVNHILSKMREPSCFKGKMPVERVDADFRDFADRLEAAIKREREAVGNAAKMRKALEGVRDWLVVHNAYVDTEREIVKLNAALAEPPRNCDRFKSEYDSDKLHEAFVKHCDSCNCPMGCIHRRDTRCMLDTRCGSILKCFAKFVLAEAKGSNNE